MSQNNQPTEWQMQAQSTINIERSTVITILKYNILENVLGKWLWDTFGETAFYEVGLNLLSWPVGQPLMVLYSGRFREWGWILEGYCT